jgi:hypothetical protein
VRVYQSEQAIFQVRQNLSHNFFLKMSLHDEAPAIKRLKSRDPRNHAELLVPGFRSLAEDDPVRLEITQFVLIDIQAAVCASKASLPPYLRKVNGCLVCTRELTDEVMAALKVEFFALASRKERQYVSQKRRPKLTVAQQRYLLSRFFVDGQSVTLCVMHMMLAFKLSEANMGTLMRYRKGTLSVEVNDPNDDDDIDDNVGDDGDVLHMLQNFDRVGENE